MGHTYKIIGYDFIAILWYDGSIRNAIHYGIQKNAVHYENQVNISIHYKPKLCLK